MPTDARQTGTIVCIKDRDGKSFGFIRPIGSDVDLFFHATDLVGLEFDGRLQEQRVSFCMMETPRGRRAASVRAAD